MRLDGVLSSCVVFRPSGGLGVLLLCVLVALTGCGSKNITSKGPFVLQEPSKGYPSVPSSSGQKTGTVYLPSDDGRPLTKAEQEAFLSEGEIDRNLSQEELGDVLLHFKYLVHKDRYTVEKNLERAQLYMPFIYETLRSRGLPRELAYVAFIESGYNPMATSSSGAAGMWQFISSTGKHYGMEQDWWMDERRDPYQSTRAAADYLDKLYKMFNDWHLAVTAYNAGEGKIQRGLAATGAKTFFELRRRNEQIYSVRDRLSDENKQYLPKFLAVCKIVRNLDKLGFSCTTFASSSQIAEVRAKPGTDLMLFSKSIGMSWDEFSAHNPAYQRYVSHPSRSTKIYVPRAMAGKAQALLFKLPPANSGKSYAGLRDYKISRGDTMASISRKTGVPVAELRRINQVSEPLRAGRVLKIPGTNRTGVDPRALASVREVPSAKGTSVASAGRQVAPSRTVSASAPVREKVVSTASAASHEVKQGDTMYSIAKRYGVTQEAILAANGMKNHNISLGQQLRIPGKGAAVASQSAKTAPVASSVRPVAASGSSVPVSRPVAEAKATNKIVQYTVQNGDTLWAIARKFNVSPIELLSLNNMSRNTALRPGDTVRVAVN